MTISLAHIERLIGMGELRTGMSRADLIAVLGAWEEEGGTSRKYPFPSIYKYGEAQFVFPPCRSASEADLQGLEYAYVDESDTEEEMRYLLR
jgi:hypothetical protein